MKQDQRSALIANAADRIADHMDDILGLFKPGMKITVFVRNPAHPDGSQDMLMTSDTIDNIITAISQRKDDETKERAALAKARGPA